MSRWLGLIVVLLMFVATACRDRGDTQDAATEVAPSSKAPAPGMCEHGVPEAICTKCVPALAAVFQAKGDWCDEHGFPESFCPICNPNAEFPDVGPPSTAPADWCAGHGLPESKCTKCNPSLVAQFKAAGDWCDEHGFPESVCPTCNPQSPPAAAADWCIEHGLPETKCSECNPSLVAEFQAAGDWCEEHGFPESVCPVCNPQPAPPGAELATLEGRTVRFQSPDIEAAAGIRTVTARRVQTTASAVECTARLAFHGDRVAEIHAIVPGIVRDVHVELGDRVERGAPLFELESTDVAEFQRDLKASRERVRTATANLERQRLLRSGEVPITSVRQLELAEQELAAAEAQASAAGAALRMVGASKGKSSGRYTLTAPIAGIVVRRPAVLGTLASEDHSLATISDTSVMWALCDVPEAATSQIALGQKLHLTVEGNAESSFEGEITWIAAEVDPRTRTVTAQAEVPNPTGQLRANQFALARIEASVPHTAVSVPRAAVQRVFEHEVVFVRTSQGVYEPRVVKRHGDGDEVAVEGRVSDGDEVVTTGAVLLRTEIMPGSIGAGCCEVEPAGDE
jgi:cobalt-zinc-cadmium efflux system membrane fusion protein